MMLGSSMTPRYRFLSLAAGLLASAAKATDAVPFGTDPHTSRMYQMEADLPDQVFAETAEVDLSSVILDEDHPAARRLGSFAPLDGNSNLATACLTPTTFSSLQNSVIGIGECVVLDDAAVTGGVLDLPNGLDIIGKLIIDDDLLTNAVTITTPFIFVQGELEVKTSQAIISPANEFLKIRFTGTTNVNLTPHPDNSAGCGGGSCELGLNPFVVAGGKLSVNAISDNCPTWKKLAKVSRGSHNVPEDTTNYGTYTTHDGEGCPSSHVLFHHAFTSQAVLEETGWTGNLGASASHDGTSQAMRVSNRKDREQGPFLDISQTFASCLLPDVDYLLSAKVRLMKEGGSNDGTEPTPCAMTSASCLRFRNIIMDPNEAIDDSIQYTQLKEEAGTYGDWFVLTARFTYSDSDLDPLNKYHALSIDGPEPGVEIFLKEVSISLPDESSLPSADPQETCKELLQNGDADVLNHNPYPFSTDYTNTEGLLVLEEEKEDGTKNNFFRIVGSADTYALFHPIATPCITQNLVYTMSMKLRVPTSASSTPITPYVELKGYPDANSDSGKFYRTVLTCDPISKDTTGDELGWVTCQGDYSMPEEMGTAQKIWWRLRTEENAKNVALDVDDISFAFKEGPVNGLIVENDVLECWGSGSEIIVTSYTLDYQDDQLAVIDSVTDQGDGTALVSILGSILPATSEDDDVNFASEVALLTRNVKVEGTGLNGNGYLGIRETPSVAQVLMGVEFSGMGQAGKDDRYPIGLQMCGDVDGSIIAKNTIRDSNHRAIVLSGTQNALIKENVAYSIYGHAFTLLHGGEWGNTFERNLGARTHKALKDLESYTDDNNYPATFFTKNSNNNFIGNVAAGSKEYGFFFHKYDTSVQGASNVIYNTVIGSLRDEVFGMFSDNSVHSNGGHGLYILQAEQAETAILDNNNFYRNWDSGMLAYRSRNLKLTGGAYADSRIQLHFDMCNNIEIDGALIKGETELYRSLFVTQPNVDKLCSSSTSAQIQGLRMPLYLYRTGLKGTVMKNVVFSEFDNSICDGGDNFPISFDSSKYDSYWNHITSFTNVTFIDSRDKSIDACAADKYDVQDMVITDLDSASSPFEGSTFTGASSIVSDQGYMKNLSNGNCMSLDDCLAYCEDSCLRTVFFYTESYYSEDYQLVVYDKNDADKKIFVPGNYYDSNDWNLHYVWRYRRFSASLPAGSYAAYMQDANGNKAWPMYMEEFWDHEPECTNHANAGDVEVIIPTEDELPLTCDDDLVRNGDMESGSRMPWYHVGGGLQYLVGAGVDNSNAIGSAGHTRTYYGITQFLDMRCLKKHVGTQYEIRAKFKMVASDMTTILTCDPNSSNTGGTACPRFRLRGQFHKDDTKTTTNRWYPYIAEAVRPFDDQGFSMFQGIFTIDQNYADMNSVMLYINDWKKNVEIILDEVSMKPFKPAPEAAATWCDELVTNGDLATGTSEYFTTYPSPRRSSSNSPNLSIVQGIDGEGDFALKATNRPYTDRSPRQDIKLGCLEMGERYIARVKYQLTDSNGAVFDCIPHQSNSATRCPEMKMKAYGITDKSRQIAYASGGHYLDTAWSSLAGVFQVTEQPYVDAEERLSIWLEDEDEPLDITIDNLSITPFPKDCNNLVLNYNFEEGSADFWLTDSWGNSRIDVVSPGAGSTYAMRSYSRTKSYRGVRQDLDARCFENSTRWDISANFKIVDKVSGDGVSCDPQQKSGSTTNCPAVKIYATECTGDSVSYIKWNEIETTWNANDFNSYKAVFEVDEYLSNCNDVRIYVEDVNVNWDIIIDDIKMVPEGAAAPARLRGRQ